MNIDVQLTNAPIPEAISGELGPHDGAWVEFRGRVRGLEQDQEIAALEYEAYAPMAREQMRRLLGQLAERHPCSRARVIHRTGIIPVGDTAIYIGVAGKHRAEVFALLAKFMNRLKQDVPIWKNLWLTRTPPSPEPVPATGGVYHAGQVLQLLQHVCQPLESTALPLAEALGRVLRQAVLTSTPEPAFDRSSVDGYAVRIDDSADQFAVVDEIHAGQWKPRQLSPGQAVRIATGAALPSEGLQVLMKEDVEVSPGFVRRLSRHAELHIRKRGEDASAGHVVVEPGTVLQAGTLGLLASVGCVQPVVTRLPRVLHFATGNEIVSPDQAPAPGQIRDSNSTLVRAFLADWGIAPVQQRVGEDGEQLARALGSATSHCDLLLISGGASVGPHDVTAPVLQQAGFAILVSKTTARPGKPLILAKRGTTLAFGLPGNPLAHFVCLNLYVRAALELWSDQTVKSQFSPGLLASDLDARGNGRETFWPARRELREGGAWLTPLPWNGSGDLTCLARADALLRVPANARSLVRGSRIEFIATGKGTT
jgi:molybdopterin molybdotransferase